ncbi:hypothetical protein COCOBI_08-3430 [Coccomyxa sp. Obi]|nr:hypothetical protein COCOBI_08-3430 [Coccomyxa sp. Obi]
MVAFTDILPSWGTFFSVSVLVLMYGAVWILQGISMETLTALIRLYVQGSVRVGGLSVWQLALQDVVVVQPEHLGGRTVFKAKSISLHPAWNILGGAPLRVIIDRPWANGLMDDDGQLYLLQLLLDVSLMREVKAMKKPGCPVCGPRGVAYDQECHCTAKHAARENGHLDHKDAPQKAKSSHKEDESQGKTSPAPSTSSHGDEGQGQNMADRKISFFRKRRHKHGKAEEDAEEEQLLSRQSDMSGGSHVEPQDPASGLEPNDGSAGRALHLEPSGFDKGLCEQQLSGEVKIPFVTLQMADGHLVVDEEIGQVFGGYVRFDVYLGVSVVRQAAQINDIDHSWTNNRPEETKLTGRPIQPFVLKLETEHLELRAGGWRTTTGFLLRQPASATVTFTPALAKYGLARLNPFLSHVMALKEANSVTASVTPLAMHVPFEAMTVRVSPLKLQIKGSRLTRGAIRLLEFRKRAGKSGGLECWTSAIEADVYRTGELVSKRMDVLVSRDFRVSKAPLHMAMWGHGRVDEDEGSIIDAIVAIPAYTLHMAGLVGLPEDYMMQISARGSAFKPTIDWFRATKTLGALMVERNVPTLGLKGVRKWLDKRCEKKVAKQGPVPLPTKPLPWDYFRRMPKRLTGGRRHYNVPLPSDSNETSSSAPGTGEAAEPQADMGNATEEEHPHADHAAGVTAVPASNNAPPSLGTSSHSVASPEEDHQVATAKNDIPSPTSAAGRASARSLHSMPTMTHALAAELRQQALEHHGSIPSEDDGESVDGGDSDSDDDDWLVEDEGRLVPAKNTLRISQFKERES